MQPQLCCPLLKGKPRLTGLWNTVGRAMLSAAQRESGQEPINMNFNPGGCLISVLVLSVFYRWLLSSHLRQLKGFVGM